jgi:hypothetical protein
MPGTYYLMKFKQGSSSLLRQPLSQKTQQLLSEAILLNQQNP